MYTDYEDDNESYYSDDDNNNSQNSERIKKIAVFILIFVVLIILILVLAKGCSNKNKNNNQSNVVQQNQTPTLLISRETLSLDVGEEFELHADVLNTKNTNKVIFWKSDDSSIVSVNDDGYVKAEGEGTTAIIASYTENKKTYTNACVVTVTSKIVKLESISLSQKQIDMKKGGVFLIEITTNPKDAKVDKFVFESADTSVAKVDDKGRILAVAAGSTVITVKTEDGSISETMSVNVSENKQTVTVIEPKGIEIVGFTNGLTVGKTTQAVFNITPNSATDKTVTWKSSNENVCKVDSKGVITGVSSGTCTIIVSTANNITASKELNVSSNVVSVEKITINGSTNINMPVGGTRYLYYTISPSDASNKKVTYKSSNPSVVFVDSNGIMAGVGVGTAIITITTQDGGKIAVANVTVTAPTASGTSSTSSTSSTSTNNSSSNNYSNSNTNSFYNYTTDSSTYNYNLYESDSNSCNAYDMLKIEHNQSKELYPNDYAIVSTISFDNTKPFTKSELIPELKLTEFNKCVKFLNYTIYHGTDANNVNTKVKTGKVLKVGDVIKLEKGNGYYRIELTGQKTSDKMYLKKIYYAYVNINNSVENYFTISSTPITKGTKFTFKKTDTKVTKIYYCTTKTDTDCTPQVLTGYKNNNKNTYYGAFSINSTIPQSFTRNGSANAGYKIGTRVCFQAYKDSKLVGEKICKYI